MRSIYALNSSIWFSRIQINIGLKIVNIYLDINIFFFHFRERYMFANCLLVASFCLHWGKFKKKNVENFENIFIFCLGCCASARLQAQYWREKSTVPPWPL